MSDTPDKMKDPAVEFRPRVLKMADAAPAGGQSARAGQAKGAGVAAGGNAGRPKGKGASGKPLPNKGKMKPKGQASVKAAQKRASQPKSAATKTAKKKSAPARPAPPEIRVLPTAPPAKMRQRHWGVAFSFLLLVLLPFAAVCYYMWEVAEDQYSSLAGFTVRQEESGGAQEILGGLAQLTGGGTGSDGNILYEFILSQEIVRAVDDKLDISGHYQSNWDVDPVFSLWPDASIEDLQWFWERIIRISHDEATGLIELRVLAFEPQMAQAIGQEIVSLSQLMINELNEQARDDALRYANADLDEAVDRLKAAREALTAFRTRTQIVDPEADIQGRLGVMNNLQQQLAEAYIEFDLLSGTTRAGDPRLSQAQQRIEVIRERIVQERLSFATDGGDNGAVAEDYPSLIAEYEGLVVDRQFAEESYRAALTALDVARAKASRQSRYLATFIKPSLPETSEFPRRWVISGLGGLFLLLTWGVLALVYYSIRDRR